MAIGYIVVYGWPKKQPEGPDSIKAMFEAFKEACKKCNLTLVLYGGPFGVPEPMVYVLKGTVADWEKALMDTSYRDAAPLNKTRTVMVWDYE